MKKEILAIIPARGGSKGIPLKNILPLAGVPLIQYTIEAAKNSRLITRSVLSSDSSRIIDVARKAGLEAPFVRPAELAADDTPALPVIRHAVQTLLDEEGYRPEIVVLLQPTSPLRRAEHIDQALERLLDSDADSIVSVVKAPHNFNPYSILSFDGERLFPFLPMDEAKNLRQMKPDFYGRNGAAVYAFTFKCLMEKNSLYGKKNLGYVMDREDSIDIDSPLDLFIAEAIIMRRREQEYLHRT